PFLAKAAARLSKDVKIEGFRPGKAPFDVVKGQVGEMNIYQEALDEIVSYFYYQAVTSEDIQAVSQPKINIEKMAPGNPIVFKAIVGLLPEVKLGDYKSVKIKKEEARVEDKEVNKVLEDLRKMQAKEVLTDRQAKKGDRIEADFEVSLDKVVIEGGQGKKYPLVIGEGMMIPGFEEQFIGLKAGEEKTFQLKFPDQYQNKMVAGKLCDFKVKLLSVYDRSLPELNDDWAKTLNAGSLQDLKEKIQQNLVEEQKFNFEQKAEIEMLNKIVEKTEFSEIPEVLVESESHRMIHEFEDSIVSQGLNFADYLKSVNKEKKDLEAEFKPKALERVKASLVIKAVADERKIEVSEQELNEETEKILLQVKGNPEAEGNIKSTGYQHYLQTIIRNRKVLEALKKELIA
ncbi:MAG: trigger factor, partial [Candidatus Komeilibacteria bacterium CG10_big_fil_rev_8_21_14_0_10_41_13]